METRLKEVLAVVNNKGGVGKTTTVQSLAAAMKRCHKDWRILVIDLDPQTHLSKLMGWKEQEHKGEPTVYDAMRNANGLPVYESSRGIFYVPSAHALQDIDIALMQQMQPYMVLRSSFFKQIDDHTGRGLTTIPECIDYVLIDCPPALSKSTYNAMAVASGLLVPCMLEGLSVDGLGPILVEMGRVKRELNQQLDLRGILPVMVDLRSNIAKGILTDLQKMFGTSLCTTRIPREVKMNEATTKMLDIYQWKPYSKVGIAYEQLCAELFN